MAGTPPRVLIVEDNHTDAMLIVDVVNVNLGDIEVLHVEDGSAAIELVRVMRPDIIVLDLNLPKLSGQDVLAQLRDERLCEQSSILVLTTSDNHRERDRVIALGAHRFATKPRVLRECLRLGGVIAEMLHTAPRNGGLVRSAE